MQYLLTVLGNRRGYGRDGVSYVELTLAHARTLPSAQCMLYLLTLAQVTTAVSADWYGALATCYVSSASRMPALG